MCGSVADIRSATLRLGEEKKKEREKIEEETTWQKYNGLP